MSIAAIEGRWHVTAEQYHADHSTIGRSMLEDFRRSPLLYHGRYVAGTIPGWSPSPEAILGTAFHCLLLEPERFESIVATLPPLAPDGKKWLRRKGSDHEAWWADVEAANAGKIALTDEQQDALPRMVAAVRDNPIAARLLDLPGENESPIRWTDDETALPCKALLDRWCGRLIVDLKTTSDPTPQAFARKIVNLGYHRQDAWYTEGAATAMGERPDFVFIAVGNCEPFECAVYDLDADALRLGDRQNREAIVSLARCMESDNWNGPTHGQINTLSLPRWADDSQWNPQ